MDRVYYLVVFLCHCYVDYDMLTHRIIDPRLLIHFSFLTHMSVYFNFIYYTLRLLTVQGIVNRILDKKFWRNYFQFTFSISFIVFLLFWGLFLTDPKLLDSGNEGISNPYCNFFLHGCNFILNLIEHLYMKPGFLLNSISKRCYFGFCCSYTIYMLIIKKTMVVSVYSFLDDGPIVISVVIVIGSILLFTGDWIYSNVHRIKNKVM